MFFAEITRNDDTQWVTVPIRQLRAVHFISKQGGRFQGLLERNRVGVIIDTTKAHARRAGKRHRPIQNVPQRETFPHSVADQSRIQTIANAHQSCFLLLRFESQEIVESPRGGVLHESAYFEMPKVDIHPWIDHILRHTIKQFVRRDGLHDGAFVLRAVIAKRRSTIKLASQREPAARNCSSDRAQHKSTPANRGTEFVVAVSDSSLCKKSKSNYQRPLEHKNAQHETDQRHQTRSAGGQANVTGAQNRPKRDCKHNDRQQNEDRRGPKCRSPRRIAPREQSKDCSANCTNDELTSYRRANAELLEMVVTADLAHKEKKRTGRDENRKAITDDHERCSHAEHSEQQHCCCHHNSGEQSGK